MNTDPLLWPLILKAVWTLEPFADLRHLLERLAQHNGLTEEQLSWVEEELGKLVARGWLEFYDDVMFDPPVWVLSDEGLRRLRAREREQESGS